MEDKALQDLIRRYKEVSKAIEEQTHVMELQTAVADVLAEALGAALQGGLHEAAVAKAVVPAPVVASTEPAPRAAEVPEEAEPPRPNKVIQNASSPWAKNFERAQKALWTNRPAGAQTILADILKKPGLSRRDRARASKMMGDAEAKKGNRARAAQWWKKSFALYDDPEDRARVARLLQASR